MPATTGVRSDGDPAGHDRQANPFAADEHALIITAENVYLPSHRQLPLRSAVDSVEKLRDLINWAWNPKRPQKMLRPRGAAPQVWIIGTDACEQLGWLPPEPPGWDEMPPLQRQVALAEALQKQMAPTLWPFTDEDWELRGEAGPRLLLSHGRSQVDIVLEPFAWVAKGSEKGSILGSFDEPEPDDDDIEDSTAEAAALAENENGSAGSGVDTSLPEEDDAAARELGRRLAACVQHLGVLPSESAGRTGAAIADAIWNARKQQNKTRKGDNQALVIDTPGPLPEGMDHPLADDEDVEPAIEWTRPPHLIDTDEFTCGPNGDAVTLLAEMDQRGSYLGSTGIELGYGEPVNIPGDAAVAEIRKAWNHQPKPKPLPFGLYRATLPAGEEIGAPEWLPLPHPRMRPDRRVQTWLTGVSVEWMCKPVADGGTGVDLDDLEIEQAWLWPKQARALDAWTKVLREARLHFLATDDVAMVAMVKSVYQMYIGRMANPELWTSKYKRHHHQPVWRAAIMAHARWRARKQAIHIHSQHGLRPLQIVVDALIYAIGPGDDGALPDLEDHSDRLGQLQLKRTVDLTVSDRYETLVLGVLHGTQTRTVAKALTKAFKEAD
ncbi:hypothetical protein [Nocardia wallacei]|uniref:hypothetical protein n=1 Tax=Nocardia wallacei TaxID=480035 RepID=UPI002455B71B|nr:hypothetical protein [Nocardia wallacei]